MKLSVFTAIDARQSPEWGEYLRSMGWIIERVGTTQMFIHTIPLIRRSVVKVQHPIGPLPLSKMETIAKKYHALFMVVEPHNVGYSEDEMKEHGFIKSFMQFAHTATIKIDLEKSEKELFSSFSENAKRNIKKSQKNNLLVKKVMFKEDTTKEYFSEFYRLLTNLSKMKKFYAPSFDEYYKKMSAFGDTSVMFFAYEKGASDPLAVVWLASYGKIITYMQTGITKRGYELLANYLLVWEGLKYAQEKKLTVFDFETIYDPRFPKENKDWIGYSEFKKRFHGILIEYPSPWIKIYNPLIWLIFRVISMLHLNKVL